MKTIEPEFRAGMQINPKWRYIGILYRYALVIKWFEKKNCFDSSVY